MKNNLKTLGLILSVAGFNSCTYDNGNMVYPSAIANMDISYMNDIKPIMATYCFGLGNQQCHVSNTNQGALGDFTTYAGLKVKVDNGTLKLRAINPAGGMPPTYSTGPFPVSDPDKIKIQKWIDAGAPDN